MQTDRLQAPTAFDADEFYRACYSTTFESKIAALEALKEAADVDMRAVLDALCDGAGGCERMAYSAPSGNLAWVSALGRRQDGSPCDRTQYAYIEVDDAGRVAYVTWGSPAPVRDEAEDSIDTYARFMRDVWEYQEKANDD